MTAWWAGIQPAEVELACAGERHRVRWEAGTLRALDHADLEGERALAALGGARCACVDVLDAWDRHATDERVLVVGSRGVGDRMPRREWAEPDDEALYGSSTMIVTSGPSTLPLPSELPGRELAALLSLPGALPDRLVGTVAAAHAGREVSPRLHAALYGRVVASLGVWLGRDELGLDLTVGERRSLTRDGELRAELPFAWIAEVWARGLAVVAGRFCLAASSADGGAWELLTVTPDLGPPETLRLAP